MQSAPVNERFVYVVPVVVLTAFAVLYWRNVRENYWIRRDGVRGLAHVTDVGGHDCIYYTYTAGHSVFTGYGPREYRDPRYSDVRTGDMSIVWFSASHPWISTPRYPEIVLYGLPWILVVTFFDVLFTIALLDAWRRPRRRQLSSG